jgi:hypothetical protein
MSQESHEVLKSKKKKDLIKMIADFSVNQIQKNLGEMEKERKIRKLEEEIEKKEFEKEDFSKKIEKLSDQLKTEKSFNDEILKFEKQKPKIETLLSCIQWEKETLDFTSTTTILLNEDLQNFDKWKECESRKGMIGIIDNINLSILLIKEKWKEACLLLKRMSNSNFSKAAIQKLILQSKRIYLIFLLKNFAVGSEEEKVIPVEKISFFQRISAPTFEEITNYLCPEKTNEEKLNKIREKFSFLKKNNHIQKIVTEFQNIEKSEKIEHFNQLKK